MEFEKKSLKVLESSLEVLEQGFSGLQNVDDHNDYEAIERVMIEMAEIMQDNYPYFHPLYAGQMLKPPHPLARATYMLSMWINPNNHALDGGRASSRLEKEAVSEIAGIFGWDSFLGHLTGGGTMANLEALWTAGKLNPQKKVVASEQAHYTHSRLSDVLGLDFQAIPCDEKARMDTDALARVIETSEVGTVVATIGTTGTGSIDPLPEILSLRKKHGFRLHADAAYGGYFVLADNLSDESKKSYALLGEADSIVVDPHKHGLQPYGCGCVLFRDPAVGRFYKHDSPYTYFTSSELHLGEISLECSRPGASAAALWATQRLLPLVSGGKFAKGLMKSRQAALKLFDKVSADSRFLAIMPPELDILVWAPAGESASRISALSERIFENAAREDLHLAVFKYPAKLLRTLWPDVTFDEEWVTCLRSCLMKPEHDDWSDRIWSIIEQTAEGL